MNTQSDSSNRRSDTELTARELLIAEKAADLAVAKMADEFYKGVGRTVINRFLILIGALCVGVAYGKGWLSGSPFGK